MAGRGCFAVRLLPGGNDHAGSGTDPAQTKSERCGDRYGNVRPCMPLWNFSAFTPGNPSCRARSEQDMSSTRRAFLRTSTLAATGLVIGVELSEGLVSKAASAFEPNAYISITPDDIVRLWITRSEMGQGVRTTLAMMLAEELEVNWSNIRLEQARPGGRFAGIRLRTSGSGSTVGTYDALRKAGAAAREMLVAAAAEEWHVQPTVCRAENGRVVQVATGHKF